MLRVLTVAEDRGSCARVSEFLGRSLWKFGTRKTRYFDAEAFFVLDDHVRNVMTTSSSRSSTFGKALSAGNSTQSLDPAISYTTAACPCVVEELTSFSVGGVATFPNFPFPSRRRFLDLITYTTRQTITATDPKAIPAASPAVLRACFCTSTSSSSPAWSLGDGVADGRRETSIPVAIGLDIEREVVIPDCEMSLKI
jgi:hypothetical protein